MLREIKHAKVSLELLAKRLIKGRMRVVENELEKYCPDCSDFFPATTEFFYATKNSPDGLFSNCKACYIEKRWPNGRSS